MIIYHFIFPFQTKMPALEERRSVKSAMAIDQRRRQKQMFERQKQGRAERINLARMLGQESDAAAQSTESADEQQVLEEPHAGECDDAGPPQRSPGDAGHGKRRGRRGGVDLEADVWAGQVMMPDWMLEAPDAMRYKWLVAPRPQGKRCLVLASAGKTVARLRTGKILQVFQSLLPNGAPGRGAGRTGGQDATVLDCIYVEELACYFVCDIMCWKGHALFDCTAEFRFFWLQQKWAEEASLASQHDPTQNPYPLHILPWYCCDPQVNFFRSQLPESAQSAHTHAHRQYASVCVQKPSVAVAEFLSPTFAFSVLCC